MLKSTKAGRFASLLVLSACTRAEDLARRVESLRARKLEPEPPPTDWTDAAAFLAALAYVVLPFALGAVLGRGLRGRRLAVVAFAAPLLVPAAFLALAPWVPLVPWDLLTLGLLVGTGITLGARLERLGWSRLGLVTMGTVAALCIVEVGLDALRVPAPPMSENPHRIELTRDAMIDDDAFCVIAGDAGFLAARRSRSAGAGDDVVHLGDSMVEGTLLEDADLFTAKLPPAPGLMHVNAGVTGAAPDFEYVLLRRVLAEAKKPRAIVLHLFPGNDASGLDMVFSCCADGGLVEPDGDGMRERCPAPSAKFSWRGALARPVPPYPMRVTASWFDLPKHAWKLTIGLQRRFGSKLTFEDRFRWITRLLVQMRREAGAKGVGFGVVVLPLRQRFDSGAGTGGRGDYEYSDEHAQLFREAVAASGAPWFDAEPAFRTWSAAHPGEGFLKKFPGDPHLDAAGHGAYAGIVAPFVAELVGLR